MQLGSTGDSFKFPKILKLGMLDSYVWYELSKNIFQEIFLTVLFPKKIHTGEGGNVINGLIIKKVHTRQYGHVT